MMKNMDRHTEIQSFVAVAVRGGFGQAAESLDTTASVVSRRVQALENRLGIRLLQRSTRRVSLTEAGARYLERCQRWLEELQAADAELHELASAVRGCLRVSVPANFGRLHVIPAMPELLARYPELDLDLDFSDRYVDLVNEGFDVAIRVGRLEDSSLQARLLAPNRRLLVASPGYLENRGQPGSPGELARHSCLHFGYYRDGASWRMEKDGRSEEVAVRGRVRANYAEALLAAALDHQGILLSASFLVAPYLRDGRLLPVLPDWSIPESGIYAVYPASRLLAPKVRAFIDFFAARFGQGLPYWDSDPNKPQ